MIIEKQTDLFEEIKLESCIVLHCISSDKAMGAGIARPLQDFFKIRENWPESLPKYLLGWDNHGYTVFVHGKDKVELIGNLVTKNNYWDKPTYQNLEEALIHAEQTLDTLSKNGFNVPAKVIMPRIGCGIDMLSWEKVKLIVEDIFEKYNVTVCYLQ